MTSRPVNAAIGFKSPLIQARIRRHLGKMVPIEGLEPPRLSAAAPKAAASTIPPDGPLLSYRDWG